MSKNLLSAFVVISLLVSNPVNALVIGVDEFVGIKNGNTVFTDDFGGTAPPPAGPLGSNTYFVSSSAPLTETQTLLMMNSANGVVSANALGQLRRAQTVTLLTPATSSGIDINSSFQIGAGFQFVQPTGPTVNGYGIRLTDSFGSPPSYITQLQVRYNEATQQSEITLSLQDFVTHDIAIMDSIALTTAPGGTDTIALWLTHSAGSTNIFGEFWFIDEDTNTFDKHTFSNASTMFQNGDYVRAQIQVFESVPEPGTLFLVGLGLSGFLLRRRRSNSL